jgi:peptidoglycan hydrolase CwlO-like protein
MKETYDLLVISYIAKSDSLEYLKQINTNLSTVISNKDKEIDLLNQNQKSYEKVVQVKEEEIKSLNNRIKTLKTQKFISYLLASGSLLFSSYILINN